MNDKLPNMIADDVEEEVQNLWKSSYKLTKVFHHPASLGPLEVATTIKPKLENFKNQHAPSACSSYTRDEAETLENNELEVGASEGNLEFKRRGFIWRTFLGSEDLRSETPVEGALFEVADGVWRVITQESVKETHAMRVISQPQMRDKLKEAESHLDDIQKGTE